MACTHVLQGRTASYGDNVDLGKKTENYGFDPRQRPVQNGAGPIPASPIMAKPFPINPKNPERICWGCDQYCAPDAMRCGNGSERTQHPVELFGEGWNEWGLAAEPAPESSRKQNPGSK